MGCFSAFKERMQKVKALTIHKNVKIDWLDRIDTVIESLKRNEEPEMIGVMNEALSFFYRKTEYCINADGDLFVKASLES